MFVHDGLVHKRFPVGPIANVPYFRKVAAAHQVNFIYLFKSYFDLKFDTLFTPYCVDFSLMI